MRKIERPQHAVSGQQRNRENRIADILAAAKTLFIADGYAAFATRRVAASVDITLSNLQYYFPTKELLLRAVIQATLDDSLAAYTAIALRENASARTRCSEVIERIFLDLSDTDFHAFCFELWAFSQHESYILDISKVAYQGYHRIFAHLIAEINPALTEQESFARASLISAQAEGMMIFAVRPSDSPKSAASIARLMKRNFHLLAGLSNEQLQRPHLSHHLRSQSSVADLADRAPASFAAGQTYPTQQSRRREDKINGILTAAAKVLTTEGYANFTQVRIAKQAGIIQSGLQHYFPTHDSLLHATVSALLGRYQKRYEVMSRPSDKPATERLLDITHEAVFESCDILARRFSFELFALAQHSQFTNALVIDIYEAYREIFIALIREIDPTATEGKAYARATVVIAQIEGIMVLHAMEIGNPSEDPSLLEMIKADTIQIALGCP